MTYIMPSSEISEKGMYCTLKYDYDHNQLSPDKIDEYDRLKIKYG